MQSKNNKRILEKVKPKTYFCWNFQSHPRNYSEVMFDGIYDEDEIVKCPICGQVHKITQRL